MGERLAGITARAFRGVRDEWVVEFKDNRSTVILGPNATGKSTITDAVEWFFTGGLRHLAREGREQAIRHIDAARETEVIVRTDGVLGGTVTYPDRPPTASTDAARSEVFLLRGATLADFMEKTKGEKWRALAEILGLDSIDQFRLDLQRATNELGTAEQVAASNFVAASAALKSRGVEPAERELLIAIQESAKKAGVAAPASIGEVIQPNWAAVFGAGSTATRLAISLGALATEMAMVRTYAPAEGDIDRWNRGAQSGGASDHPRLTFVRVAATYLARNPTPGKCPLCGQTVNSGQLRAQVVATIADLKNASDEFDAMDAAIGRLDREADAAVRKRESFLERARGLSVTLADLPESPRKNLAAWKLQRAVIDRVLLAHSGEAFAAWGRESLDRVKAKETETAKGQNKELSEAGQLRELAIRWSTTRSAFAKARTSRELAEKVFGEYQKLVGSYFDDILSQITDRVAANYASLHPDEHIDKVRVEVAGDKGVELAASFYGHDLKPPHGLLSESHLNSFGVSLFLAMAETFNRNLAFLVLDDVVNSFDAEHRGRLADLLADGYEAFQLIVLTHDRQFYQHLTRKAASWNRLELTSWSFGDGPRSTKYETGALISRASAELNNGNLDGAARTARRALEETLQEICESLEALLPFRRGLRNDQREIGELLPGTRRLLKDTAPKRLVDLKEILTKLDADVAAVLNVESHASTTSSSGTEVGDAIARIDELSESFTCQKCGSRVWHVWDGRAGRCRCGSATYP